MPKEWTKVEEKQLKAKYEKLTNAELAELFGVTPKSIEAKLRRLELKRKKKKVTKGVKKRKKEDKVSLSVRPLRDERRQAAIQGFDEAVALWIDGKNKEAIARFQVVIDEYTSVLDVVQAAKHYLERCKSLRRPS